MTLLPMLAAVALTVALTTKQASANAQAFLGDWRHITISEDVGSTPSCRTLTVTTRRYMLSLTPDRRLVLGSYGRATNQIWLGPTAGCDGPPTPVDTGQRADWWAVRGSVEDDGRLSLVAEHDRCLGACAGEPAVQEFSTKLSLLRDSLVDVIEETNERLYFVKDDVASEFEAEASERLFTLLRPLYQKSCTGFLEESMDPQSSADLPRTEFCMTSQRLADLLGDVIADKPVRTIHFNRATFFNHADQRQWSIAGGGDVLVEHLMILDGQGNGVLLAAIMRRQLGGDWKILRLMP